MYYPQELAIRPRARPPLYGQVKPTGSQRKLLRLLLPYLKDYCDCSSVHGIRYLTDRKLHRYERLVAQLRLVMFDLSVLRSRFMWLLILLTTIVCATLVYVDLTELYYSVRTQTIIEDSMRPTFVLSFPSVALCPTNRINYFKLQQEAPERFLGANVSAELREVFIRFFVGLSAAHFDKLQALNSFFKNETLAARLSELDGLDMEAVLEFLMLDCQDIFQECQWRNKPQNCCEIFELQRTEAGICWVFNSLTSPEMKKKSAEDKFYPRRSALSGSGSGLDIMLQLNKSLISTGIRGVYLMVKQSSQWSDATRLLPRDSVNRLSIQPRYTSAHARTRGLTAEVRKCIFPDEVHDSHYKNLPGFVYWRGNCRSRCHQEYAVDLCKCSPSLFFPQSQQDNFTQCKPSNFQCLYDHRLTFAAERIPLEAEYVDSVYHETMTCDCFNSCAQLIFDQIYTSTALE
ncbi:pickpocket protein 19 [Drosophila busckii]|uniref:pickpocket protein 19 n=1 Tax=Drosophila busckii TaxID=30019 RepID=UPI0014329FD6|nr:pickpocket protein 19 [Drosophila busckii]